MEDDSPSVGGFGRFLARLNAERLAERSSAAGSDQVPTARCTSKASSFKGVGDTAFSRIVDASQHQLRSRSQPQQPPALIVCRDRSRSPSPLLLPSMIVPSLVALHDTAALDDTLIEDTLLDDSEDSQVAVVSLERSQVSLAVWSARVYYAYFVAARKAKDSVAGPTAGCPFRRGSVGFPKVRVMSDAGSATNSGG